MSAGASAAGIAPRPPLAAFGAIWFAYFASVGLFNPYAPLWFKELGFSTLAIGAIASLQSWTRVLAPYGWGWLGDHTGRRVELVRVAAAGTVLASAGLMLGDSYAWVAALTFLLFAFNGGVVPLSEAALSQRIATVDGMDNRLYGRVRMWGSMGFIVAVTITGVALEQLGIGVFPWMVLGMCAVLLAASLRLPAQREARAAGQIAQAVWPVLRKPVVGWFFAAVFFTVLAHVSLYAFLSLYLDSLGYARWVVGVLWAVAIALEVAFFWQQGRVFARLDAHRWLELAAGLSALRFGATAAFGSSIVVLLAAQLLHVVTFAAQHAACITLINRHFPGPLRGRGQALYTMLGYGVSGVIGGVAGGALSERFGFESVFWAAALAALAGLGCALRASRLDRD